MVKTYESHNIAVLYTTDSIFDKNHYKNFHRVQCTEPTPKWHLITSDIFFFQIQWNIQWRLKMQWATAFYANHLLDVPIDVYG